MEEQEEQDQLGFGVLIILFLLREVTHNKWAYIWTLFKQGEEI